MTRVYRELRMLEAVPRFALGKDPDRRTDRIRLKN
jgi:hypothetical protein